MTSTKAPAAPSETAFSRTEVVLRALSSGPRMQIVTLLSRGADGEACCADREVCACVFVDTLGLSASTVSHHMKALTEAGLVTSDKRGLWVYYRLVPETLVEVADELRALAGVGGAGAPAARSCCDTAKAGA